MTQSHRAIGQSVADRFSQSTEVEAVAVAGSVATGRANPDSDIDLYVFPTTDITPDTRLAIAHEFFSNAQVVDYWGPAVVWHDADTGVEVEAMFFNTRWMEDLVLRPLEQYQAQMGYTTSFWHTIKVAIPLFDRSGWLSRLKEKADQPYPPQLVQAIIDLNYPLLRDIYPSYRAQIAKAIKRNDGMLINSKIVAFLASYFDMLFTVNRMLHPGEKRLLDIVEATCAKRPPNLRTNVNHLLEFMSVSDNSILDTVDQLIDDLRDLLQREALLF